MSTISTQLAIRGGSPVRTRPFQDWPTFDEREERALLGVLRSGEWWRFSYGDADAGENRSQVALFQEAFAQAHDCEFGVVIANGTAALEVILRSLDIGPGDEVIVPPYTFIASASAILQVGAVPVFVDIGRDTYNIDPTRIEEAITPRTRAIMPVHFGGQAADMEAIDAIAQKHDLRVVEDAAHAHGGKWRNRSCGALSDAAAFSFQASKNMTAGEGGIVTTNDESLAELCRSYLWAGREKNGGWYEHVRLGWNYRITEFQAAILRVQLERLEEQARARDDNGRYLARMLKQHTRGITPQTVDERVTRGARHLFIFRYDPRAFGGMSRESFIEALCAEGIPCSAGYSYPLYRNPMFLNKDFWKGGFPCVAPFAEPVDFADYAERCPESEAACRESVWMMQNLFLGDHGDMDEIVEAVAKIQKASGGH